MTSDLVTPPWPYYTLKQAARKLDCAPELLEGLANNPIPAMKIPTIQGNRVLVFQRSAIDEIRGRVDVDRSS